MNNFTNRISAHIPIRIHSARQSNRVGLQIPSRRWVVVPIVVLNESRFFIMVLPWEAQVITTDLVGDDLAVEC